MSSGHSTTAWAAIVIYTLLLGGTLSDTPVHSGVFLSDIGQIKWTVEETDRYEK